MAILMPHLVNERNALMGTGSSAAPPNPALVAALRQRTAMLQEENDELYNVLRRAETGRLDEEVRGLRVLVGRLERALQGWWLTFLFSMCLMLFCQNRTTRSSTLREFIDSCRDLKLTLISGRKWKRLQKF